MCGKLWVVLGKSQLSTFQMFLQHGIILVNLSASGLQFYMSRKTILSVLQNLSDSWRLTYAHYTPKKSQYSN